MPYTKVGPFTNGLPPALNADHLDTIETQYDVAMADTATIYGLGPALYGAVGDGVADDTTAIQATITAAAGGPIRFERAKTYKVTSTLTFTGDLDGNGSTISSTNSINIAAGVTRNLTLTGPGSLLAASKSGVTIDNVKVVATAVTSQGISLTQCTDSIVRNCQVSGGSFRGILLDRCDRFTVERNYIKDVTDPAGYGILLTSATGEVHGDGAISKNVLYNCNLGICSNGGEANPGNPGFTGAYTLNGITITENKVYMLSYALHAGIWATCSKGLAIEGNYINGASDTGLDFECCTQASAIGNTILDVLNGGLSAIFGSTDILFEGNTVQFNRATTGSASTASPVWKNTSPLMVLLKDNPQRVTIRGNTFRVSNGTLGRFSLGTASSDLVIKDNDLTNVYMSGSNSTAGQVVRTHIEDNTFNFTTNLNNPAIYHERVLRYFCERNEVTLPAGEVMESTTRHYLAVYDASGDVSNWLYFIGNTVDDIPTGNTQGISFVTLSSNAAVRAYFIHNYVDKIGVAGGITYTGITFEKNYKLASVGLVQATQNGSSTTVTMPTVA